MTQRLHHRDGHGLDHLVITDKGPWVNVGLSEVGYVLALALREFSIQSVQVAALMLIIKNCQGVITFKLNDVF